MSAVVNNIAVVVADQNDEGLMRRLLSTRQCQFYSRKLPLSVSSTSVDSVVVFHRSSSLSPKPVLSFNCRPRRIIVMSDCMDEQVVVHTLNSGAHHYFDIRESESVLTARLAAALRSYSRTERQVVEYNPFSFHVISRTVYRNKRRLGLSPREFELAYYLFSNRDRVIRDTELLTGVWTLPTSVDTRRIDTAICRVRNKLGMQSDCTQWKLVRLRGLGYRLVHQKNARIDVKGSALTMD